LAAAIVGKVVKLGLQREADELFGTIVFVDPGIPRLRAERKRYSFTHGRFGREMLRPHDGASLSTVAENDRRPRANDVCAEARNVATAHMFVEKFHHGVSKGVSGWVAEIIFGDGTIAVWLLGRAVDGLAAGEDETREFALNGDFEHVRHAKNIHARGERSVFVHKRTHDVREMNGVSDVGMLMANCHYVAKVAYVRRHGIELRIDAVGYLAEGSDRLGIRRMIGRDSWDAAPEKIAHNSLTNEAEAACNKKLHRSPLVFSATPPTNSDALCACDISIDPAMRS
jgi:hypothetical protein